MLDREPRPVTFVSSYRLGQPPSIDRLRRRLEFYPGLRFKLDPTSDWDEELVRALAETGAVDSVDLKGMYKGTVVDQAPDARLYRLVAEGFPEAWIEDPELTAETEPILAPHRDRITWDAPNDVAPSAYNENELRPGLPESPLEPAPAATGFTWG